MATFIIGRENRLVPLPSSTLQSKPPADASVHPRSTPTTGASAIKFILRFNDGGLPSYLHSYRESTGVWRTLQIPQAKLFDREPAESTAKLLRAEAVRVLVDANGNLRLGLPLRESNRISRTSAQVAPLREEKVAHDQNEGYEQADHESPEAKQQPERRIAVTTALACAAEGGVSCRRHPVSNDAKALLLQFISNYLGVRVFGVQAGFKSPDFYLFEGPFGTTMAVPTTVMLVSRAAALSLIQQKLSQKKTAFEKDTAFPPEAA